MLSGPNPPTKRSEVTQSPPSLLSDRSRPLTTRSTELPPPPTTCSLAPGLYVPMPTLPLFSTVSRQSPLFQKPIWPVPYPPTNRSAVIHSPPSLLFDRSRPFTRRSTESPP